MKLIRFGAPGAEKAGLLLDDGTRVDASSFGSDWDERFLGSDGLLRLEAWARERADSLPRVPKGDASTRAPSARRRPGFSAPGFPNRMSFIRRLPARGASGPPPPPRR
jgi:hypothetical protein